MELKELMELKTIVFSSIWGVFREKHTSFFRFAQGNFSLNFPYPHLFFTLHFKAVPSCKTPRSPL